MIELLLMSIGLLAASLVFTDSQTEDSDVDERLEDDDDPDTENNGDDSILNEPLPEDDRDEDDVYRHYLNVVPGEAYAIDQVQSQPEIFLDTPLETCSVSWESVESGCQLLIEFESGESTIQLLGSQEPPFESIFLNREGDDGRVDWISLSDLGFESELTTMVIGSNVENYISYGNETPSTHDQDSSNNAFVAIRGMGGDDEINIGSYGVTGDENSTIEVYGGRGDDSVISESIAVSVFGDDGNDSIEGGEADDLLLGGSGSDYIDGQGGNDTLDGFGNQFLSPPSSVVRADDLSDEYGDSLFGGSGNDLIFAGSGDQVSSGDGNDEIHLIWSYGSSPIEIFDFEEGRDRLNIEILEWADESIDLAGLAWSQGEGCVELRLDEHVVVRLYGDPNIANAAVTVSKSYIDEDGLYY
jgi:Ca2+-binding RTX toxin-like protein